MVVGCNDACVCCGRDSGVAHDTPVAKRKYYIDGSGQLCSDCYLALYIRKSEDEIWLSPDEWRELLRICRQ